MRTHPHSLPRSVIPRWRLTLRGSTRRCRITLSILAATLGLFLLACSGSTERGAVHVSTIDGSIGPVTADFIDRAIDRAEEHDAVAWVLQLDTPGGLISATDDIVQRIEAATVPVLIYVSPLGARAASAGTFITMAAHIAAMAPSTQIGAAHPVAGGGDDIEGDLGDKVTNDAAADIRAIAQLRGRNQDWAESAVRESISATAEEAVELNVVELVATDLHDLLAQIDGRTIALLPGGPEVTLRTRNAPIVETNMHFFERVLDFLATPDIAFLLISLGGLALLIEIISPGLVGPGVFGVIMLLVGFWALDALDTNPAGIALIALAFVLLLAEVLVAGFGFLGIGGIVALIAGGLILIGNAPDAEQVSLWLLASVAIIVAAVLGTLWLLILKDRRHPPTSTASLADRITGHHGIAQTAIAPTGTVIVDSELWSAGVTGDAISSGTRVQVAGVEGLRLLVEPLPDTQSESPTPF